jgi:hypothetical protein
VELRDSSWSSAATAPNRAGCGAGKGLGSRHARRGEVRVNEVTPGDVDALAKKIEKFRKGR